MPWSHDSFNFLLPPKVSLEGLKLNTSNTGSPCDALALGYKLSLEWAWSRSRDVFKFWEISDNNSKMVQDRRIVYIKVE